MLTAAPSPRDVCAKCGVTLEKRVQWWRTPSPSGAVKIGSEGGLFLWCDHCQKAICGGCSIDLGMSCGCPFCKNKIKEFGNKQVQALLLQKGIVLRDPNEKGREFEEEVAKLLGELTITHPKKATVETKPRIMLQNDEFVVPDFHLTVELSYERRHYFIECQNREQDSKSILHKIQHVRNKQRWKTFLFLYPDTIAPELIRAFNVEGVMHLNLPDFRLFIQRLQASIAVQPEIKPEKSKPDGAMLSSQPPQSPWRRW
jgi:hypothetical protein